jgi:TP901 family phage tail tape measure protein
MTIGQLTVMLGVDSQGAINSMTHFERTMITLINKIDSTLERMEASMAGVTGAALDMRNKTVAGFTATANAAKVATVATTQYTSAVVAANVATKASVVTKGTSAISQSAINNSLAGAAGVRGVATAYNVSPMIAKDAINQTIVVARETAKQTALFNKMHNQAIAMDNKRTQICNANRIKEAYAEADAATKRIMTFNKMHSQAITEDIKRTKIAEVNTAKITAVNNAAVGNFVTRLSTISQKLRTFGYLSSAMVTLPMVMIAKSTIKMGMDFEFTLKKMIGLAGVAKDSLAKIGEEANKISKETGVGAQKIAEAYYYVASSGIKGANVLKVTEMAAKGAASGMGEISDLAKLLTSAMNAYADSGLTVTKMMDVLTATIRVGKAEPAEMVTALGTILPIAEKLGLTVEDMSGALATMTLITNSTATSATYFRNVLMKLLNPTPEVVDAMDSMGISMEQIHKLLKSPDGFIKTMELLGITTEKYGVTMDSIFPEMRSLLGALNYIGAGLQRLKDNTNEVKKATGDFQKHLVEMSTTMEMRWNKAIEDGKNSLRDFGTVVAMAVIPILEKLIGWLTSLIKWFDSLNESGKKLTLGILAIIAALGPLSLALSLIGYIAGPLILVYDKLAKSIMSSALVVEGASKSFMRLGFALRALPWVAVGVGLVKLIGWFSDQHNAAVKAAEGNTAYNKTLATVEGTLKRLTDMTVADFAGKGLEGSAKWKQWADDSLINAKQRLAYHLQEAGISQKEYDNAVKVKEIMGTTGGNKQTAGERRKALRVLDFPMRWKNQLNIDVAEVDKFTKLAKVIGDAWTENVIKSFESTGPAVQTVKKEFLILEQLQAAMEKGQQAATSFNAFKASRNAANAKVGVGKGFGMGLPFETPGTGGWQKDVGEPPLEEKLMSERAYLDAKYKMDIAAAKKIGKDTALIIYRYNKEVNRLNLNDIQSYLNSASEAINSISALIEASKQKELSAAGNNAKRREKIEREYMQKQKAWAIAQALINGALAVTNLIANVPMSVLNPATWVGIGVAAASTAAQIAIIAGQKMKEGGIVPSGYPNDTYPALLTSGETVTPPNKLSNIGRQNSISDQLKDVVFHIEGTELVGVFKNHSRKVSSYS